MEQGYLEEVMELVYLEGFMKQRYVEELTELD